MRCPRSLNHVHSCTRRYLSQAGGVRQEELASYKFHHCYLQLIVRDGALSWIKNTWFSVLFVGVYNQKAVFFSIFEEKVVYLRPYWKNDVKKDVKNGVKNDIKNDVKIT